MMEHLLSVKSIAVGKGYRRAISVANNRATENMNQHISARRVFDFMNVSFVELQERDVQIQILMGQHLGDTF